MKFQNVKSHDHLVIFWPGLACHRPVRSEAPGRSNSTLKLSYMDLENAAARTGMEPMCNAAAARILTSTITSTIPTTNEKVDGSQYYRGSCSYTIVLGWFNFMALLMWLAS